MGTLRHSRRGLVLRPSLGAGVTHIFRRTERNAVDGTGPTSSSSSITAWPLEFRGFIGGALARDLILGGFIGLSQSPGATFNFSGESLSFEEGIHFNLLGTQLMYFLESGSPWQLGASVAFVNWSAHAASPEGEIPRGNGILGTIELGYHLWVGPRWELGFLGQIDVGATQNGEQFRVSEVLVQNNDSSYLLRGHLSISLSYY